MELVIRSHKYTRRGLKIQLDDGNPVRLPDVVYIHFVMPTKQDICPLQSNLDWLTPALFSKACRTGISIVPVLVKPRGHKECCNPDNEFSQKGLCEDRSLWFQFRFYCNIHAACRALNQAFFKRYNTVPCFETHNPDSKTTDISVSFSTRNVSSSVESCLAFE